MLGWWGFVFSEQVSGAMQPHGITRQSLHAKTVAAYETAGRAARRQLVQVRRFHSPLLVLKSAYTGDLGTLIRLENHCDELTYAAAALGGHLHILNWLLNKGVPMDWKACSAAIRGRHMHVLKWLRELNPPCPLHVTACHEAAGAGDVITLQWLFEQGCRPDSLTSVRAASGGHLNVLSWLIEHCFPTDDRMMSWLAAEGGHINVLSWMKQNGWLFKGGVDTWAFAAKGGQLEVLKWANYWGLLAPGLPRVCTYAASGGHLRVLQWARENQGSWGNETCAAAAAGGHLEVLQWARDNGCSWDAKTCIQAAEGGHLEVLQWARANGCEWDAQRICTAAAEGGHVEMLEWIRQQGVACNETDAPDSRLFICPWDHDTCREMDWLINYQ